MATKKLKFTESKPDPSVRLDLGAGKGAQTPDGFTPVDKHAWKGVKVVDLCSKVNVLDPFKPVQFLRWPWKSNSVDEVHSSMLIHYLTPAERVHFFNELFRVMKPGATARFITPMWSAQRAYVDVQAQWPPVSEGFYHTLSKAWRDAQNSVDTSGLTCDFDAVMGYGIHPAITTRNEEYQANAVAWSKEAAQDLIATLTKR
jgi:predicted SAM-dependent methyltransferase